MSAGQNALRDLFKGLNREGGLSQTEISELAEKESLLFMGNNSEQDGVVIRSPISVVIQRQVLGEIEYNDNGKYVLTDRGRKRLEVLEEDCKSRGRRL